MKQIPKIKINNEKSCLNCQHNTVLSSDAHYLRCKTCLGSFKKINFELKKEGVNGNNQTK